MSLIYAHRAARGLAPENTLEGCELCLELPVDVIDLDICITKEGTLVATHDPELNPDLTRGPDGKFLTTPLSVSSLTFPELQQFNVGKIDPNSPYAAYFPDQKGVEVARIPSLKQVLRLLKNHPVRLQLEIKVHSQTMVEALYSLLRETDFIERTQVQSFDFGSLRALQKRDASVQTSYVSEGPFSPQVVQRLQGKCWSPFEGDVTKEWVDEAHALDLKVIPWGYPEKVGTEYHQDQIKQLIEWGVDGIITDRPDKLRGACGN
ncbi:MAG: hypothetical protein S4CHLAM2_18530 [Chlamydiales bacterium]|nr:hypothetical protein [Chlamydiales bacterium]